MATIWFTVRGTVWLKRRYSLPSTVLSFNGRAIKELVVCVQDIIIVSEIHQDNTTPSGVSSPCRLLAKELKNPLM